MTTPEPTPAPTPRRGAVLARGGIVAVCLLHSWAIWMGMGGLEGIRQPWPLARHDHPHFFHGIALAPGFLGATGTTAGYDPFFMAGYAQSAISNPSTTLPGLLVGPLGGRDPVRAYKIYVLLGASAPPWLFALAAWWWALSPRATLAGLVAFGVYLWTDWPINYAEFGMVSYFLAVPMALAVLAPMAGFLGRGGFGRWLAAALGMALAVLVHPTMAMVLAPAAVLAYLAAIVAARGRGGRLPFGRHVGTWLVPAAVLAANAFWWLPVLWLRSTRGASGHAFGHGAESVVGRLAAIVAGGEPPVQAVLIGGGLAGLAVLARRDRLGAAALGALALAGFGWGYLAGFAPALDALQPGRHTYVFYTALALALGAAWDEAAARLRAGGGRLDRWATLAIVLVGVRVFGPALAGSVRARVLAPSPFLSSRPTPQLRWVVERVKRHVGDGERLLYEEGGLDVPGVPDPFQGGRYSGLIPYLTNYRVELLGGSYLHAHLAANFTQFGEGALFGLKDWDRAHFERYARLYRPAAILCWSPRARAFCRANPDLVTIVDRLDLGRLGTLLIGRVAGFGGAAIRGTATVRARPGALRVEGASGDLDGMVVLRYHSVPCLRSRPPIPLESVHLEGDPVPFVGFRPPPGTFVLELEFPP